MAWEQESLVDKPRIAILLPYRQSLYAQFVESIWGPLRFIGVPWCDKIPKMSDAVSLPLARNALVEAALELDVTHLLWLDSDGVMETPEDPNEAMRILYKCDAPIAACLYVAKQASGFNYAAWMKAPEGYTPIVGWQEGTNWISVSATGLHFCLIKREVFENVPKPWFHWNETGKPSEDFYFFEKAKEAGYEVRIRTDVRLSHLGVLKVRSDKRITTVTG